MKSKKEKEVMASADVIGIKKEKKSEVSSITASDLNIEKMSPLEISQLTYKLKDYLNKDMKANESLKFKTVYFEFNQSNLMPTSLSELKALTSYLKEHPETKIEIAGHGDIIGAWYANVILSNQRAKEVYDFLVANNISPKRMFFYGKGSTMPVAPNDTEENRSKNRRVDVYLLK